MSDNKLRVAAYCRVSTDKDDQVNSLVSQRKYFAEYIERHPGWELKNVYSDDGYSGTQTKKRTGFNAMIEEAMLGGIDLILTKEVCRFARNTVDTLSYTRKLKEKGVGVIFTIDNIDTRDSDGELRLTLMASIAQEESRKTSERVKWGQKRRMEQGVVFGRDLLGYTVQGGILSVNEEEASIVRAIFHKYTNEGKGVHVIARELAEEGMHPKQVPFWSDTTIFRVLHNEKYVGDLCQKKTWTPDYLTHAKKYNRDKSQMIYLKNHHEPLIDRALWERTQEELVRRSAALGRDPRYSSRYWCSGKLYCGVCGRRFVSRTKHLKNGEYYKAWRCYAAAMYGASKILKNGTKDEDRKISEYREGGEQRKSGEYRESREQREIIEHRESREHWKNREQRESREHRERGEVRESGIHKESGESKENREHRECREYSEKAGCNNRSVNEKVLLACVHYCINQLQIDREALRDEIMQEMKTLRGASASNSGINNIQEKIDTIHVKKRKAIDLFLDGVITQKDLEEQTKWYEEQVERLSKQLASAKQVEAIVLRQADAMEQVTMPLDEIMTFDERNHELYGELLDRMVIYPGNRIEIWLKELPFGMRLTFSTHGRQENYVTEILDMELVAFM